ncbi:hypothetical protein L596_022025 [Steinernema carpocapsae]|uniref:Uncharacterized protein n=1 Tax=Steinernema carpocapsae TaxID=34508 RepID=A0A4U5MKV7_STECR|nr:hypothetical protein L596_022025 [Steinernema carpocapsae]
MTLPTSTSQPHLARNKAREGSSAAIPITCSCGHPGRVFHPLKLLNSGNGQIFVCLIGTCTSGRTTVDEIMAQKRSSTTRIGSSWAEAVRELLKPSSGSDVTTELIWTASIRPSMIPTGNFC